MRMLGVAAALLLASPALAVEMLREDTFIPGPDGSKLHVREIRPELVSRNTRPLLLLHGARVPGVASFDLPIAGGSLAEELARAGHRVFVMDARGYGGSTRPSAMDQPPDANPPLVTMAEVVADVEKVVDWILARTSQRQLALYGWATGGHWLGAYAAAHPRKVSHLILVNALYGASAPHPMLGLRSSLEVPGKPGQLDVRGLGAYGYAAGASLLGPWDRNIPDDDKDAWRDPAVADAYVKAALESDPTSTTRYPPSLRAPTGALQDSHAQALGQRLWSARKIKAATLIVRSERDFWSRPEDVALLSKDLGHARRVKKVTLEGATHFVHLDRAEHGRAELLRTVTAFLERR